MKNKFNVQKYLSALIALAQNINAKELNDGIKMIEKSYLEGRKIFTCGNGGSALTASHYVTDWNKMVNLHNNKKFYGICLNDNIGLISAYANDVSYEEVFAGQLKGQMDEGDLLVVVSGSGNSRNVVNAVKAARDIGGSVLAVVGFDGGELLGSCDHAVWVRSCDMQLCEDMHMAFGHMVMKSLTNCEVIT